MRSYGKEKKQQLAFPYIFIALCFLFAIIGFSFFILLSQRRFSEIPTRRSVNEETESLDHGSVPNNIPFQVLSWSPRVFYLRNFATKQQCEAIIDMAKPKLKPSKLALRKGETADTTRNVRTSTGVFISADEDESGLLDAIEEKIASATRIPSDYYESFNILRYQLGQKYDSHYDAFNPAEYGPQRSQRLVTFLLFLSTVKEGGETMFPFENGRNMNGSYDYEKCIGLKVKPRQGDAIFFYNLFPNKTIDQTSLHGSCPVIKGEKWVATKWIRDQIYD
ncbi:PREDICTED: prolyl 4-hydroxylase 13-like [Camelina sativa]|uniref:Prolyl 4-hydroxylase 13-like n=1 Tax=Camelina sativa TaxID=90675 RepID=A0ABM0SWB4_CAMSA|nr:PREDICTED: prolyl 4-hydroxylase 13-like [Camelina sativa]